MLDFNASDTSDAQYSREFFDFNVATFFVDPDAYSLTVDPPNLVRCIYNFLL